MPGLAVCDHFEQDSGVVEVVGVALADELLVTARPRAAVLPALFAATRPGPGGRVRRLFVASVSAVALVRFWTPVSEGGGVAGPGQPGPRLACFVRPVYDEVAALELAACELVDGFFGVFARSEGHEREGFVVADLDVADLYVLVASEQLADVRLVDVRAEVRHVDRVRVWAAETLALRSVCPVVRRPAHYICEAGPG